MYSLRLLNRIKPGQQARLVCNYPTLRDSKPVPNVEASAPKMDPSNPSVIGRTLVTPRNIDKRILVWMKYYKSVDEVPDKISYESLDKAQNWFRIRLANWMMAGTVLGVFYAVYYGKKRAARGESVDQINMDWHDKINADYQTGLSNAAAEKK